jgi:hypothetical protein
MTTVLLKARRTEPTGTTTLIHLLECTTMDEQSTSANGHRMEPSTNVLGMRSRSKMGQCSTLRKTRPKGDMLQLWKNRTFCKAMSPWTDK